MKKVLAIDDDRTSLQSMASLLEAQGYQVHTAINGMLGLKEALSFRPDVILLDVMMPEMDGFTLLRELKGHEGTQHIPIILITALEDRESRLTGFKAGADEFVSKPFDRVELILRIQNLVKVKEYGDFLSNYSRTLETMVQERTIELEKAHHKIRTGYLDTIYRLTMAAEYKDEHTANHLKRMSFYCQRIAKRLEMSEGFLDTIFYAAPMHDIGKIGIPDAVLLKAGRLTAEEFELTKTHTTMGGKILEGSDSVILQMAEHIALSHHEKWDGSGYPRGLKAEEIPLEGRITTIADQYDALRSIRPYKHAFSHKRTVEIISRGDDRTLPGHFDPRVLQAFIELESEFDWIYEEHKD